VAAFAAVDGAELAYADDGPHGTIPLLFLHGWQGSKDIWAPVTQRLRERRRTIALDLRGFGESNAAPGPYTVETFADDLSALIAALDLDPLVVVGHSMGAAIAQRFAIDRPDAVEGLVLVAPVPASGVALSPKTEALFRGTAGNAEKANAWIAGLTQREPSAAMRAIMRAAAATTPPQVALESFDSWTRLHFADEAATIDTPTLVIAGAADSPAFARERVADVIEGARFEIVPDAGHYVPLEEPARIAMLVERFIDGL
jgi:pimeloyl-ACP methyl ester carboxylesterase